MQNEAHIAGVGTAVPYPIKTDQVLKHDRMMRESFEQPEETIQQFHDFIHGTGIRNRHYAHPHWLPDGDTPDDYPDHHSVSLDRDIFTPSDYAPSYWERMTVFADTAPRLAIAAAATALANWGGRAEDITHIITTCTSGWSEPGIAVAIMQALELPLDCQKAELNFNGCFCGATCLRLARTAIRAGEAKNVLVVAVEVASTHYDLTATDPSSLVAHALFADGAAAMVISTDGDWRYVETGMSLVPGSTHLLGFNPPHSPEHSTYRMILHRNVGKRLGAYFHQGRGAELLDHIGDTNGTSEKPALGVHPGGPNILDHVGKAFHNKGWSNCALQPSYDTLQNNGNLGSAAMLFVLAHQLETTDHDSLISLAFGPGVTVEWAALCRPESIH